MLQVIASSNHCRFKSLWWTKCCWSMDEAQPGQVIGCFPYFTVLVPPPVCLLQLLNDLGTHEGLMSRPGYCDVKKEPHQTREETLCSGLDQRKPTRGLSWCELLVWYPFLTSCYQTARSFNEESWRQSLYDSVFVTKNKINVTELRRLHTNVNKLSDLFRP